MTREDAVEILTTAREMYPGKSVIRDAFTLALSALRPVSREQVERVWRGCPHCLNSSARQNLGYQYCEHCGRPLTDKAVDIRLKELEALKDGPEQ